MSLSAYPRADFARRRVTVHDWHLAIHQHDVVAAPLHGLQCLLPVRDDVELASKRLEHVAGDDLVDLVVFGQQRACQNTSCYRRRRRRHIGSGRDTQGLCERLIELDAPHRLGEVAVDARLLRACHLGGRMQ